MFAFDALRKNRWEDYWGPTRGL